MGDSGGPHSGVVLNYENVRVAITGNKITITVNGDTTAEKVVVIDRKTGEVED